MNKLLTKLYFSIILSTLFLFSCGKCSPFFGIVMDGPQAQYENIQFTFTQVNFDTTDIFYSGLFTENDLEAFIINDDNTFDTLDLHILPDNINKKSIVYPLNIFTNDNLGEIKIEFRLNINSKEFIIPISFTKTLIPKECGKDNTRISNIKVDNIGHTIVNKNAGYSDEPYILHYVTLVVPRSEIP